MKSGALTRADLADAVHREVGLTRQDGSAMERLLASRLSNRVLLPFVAGAEKCTHGGDIVYIPAREGVPSQANKLPSSAVIRKATKSFGSAPCTHEGVGIVTPHSFNGNEPQPPPQCVSLILHRPPDWPA